MKHISKNKKALVLFSGGKDSVYALSVAKEAGYEPILVSFINPSGDLQLADGIELDQVMQEQHMIFFDFKKVSLMLSDKSLVKDLINGLTKIILNEQPMAIYTGDLDHPQGICHILRKNFDIPVFSPAGDIYKEKGGLGYIKRLIDEGFEMQITGFREDVKNYLKIGDYLTLEYAQKLEEFGIDCTAEDGEFQTLVTKCPIMSASMNVKNFEIKKHKGRDDKHYTYYFMTRCKDI